MKGIAVTVAAEAEDELNDMIEGTISPLDDVPCAGKADVAAEVVAPVAEADSTDLTTSLGPAALSVEATPSVSVTVV